MQIIKDLFIKYVALIVLIIAMVSLFVPQSALWISTSWINYLLMVVMFGMGLTLKQKEDAIVFTKTGYTSYLSEMKAFDEIHLCGFDTEACVYKTALDLVETGVRPVVLKDYCYSSDEQMHIMGLRILEKNIGIRNLR